MLSVKVESKKHNGIYEARSVSLEKTDGGSQRVNIVNEGYQKIECEINGDGDVWVMNAEGKTVAHYHIDDTGATVVSKQEKS